MKTRATLDALLRKSGRVLGTWTQFADPDLIDALGHAGFDYTIIDCEHGPFGIETAAQLIRACEAAGIAPLVRVPKGDTVSCYKALDAGAAGILAPCMESAEEALRMVDSTRFAPYGERGACPIVRSAHHSAAAWKDFAQQQEGVGLIAMIESPEGVSQATAICATPGLKAVMLGPFDLSVAMGHAGDHQHPKVQQAMAQVLVAAHMAGCPVFVPVFAPEQAALQDQMGRWAALGIRYFAVGADKIIVSHAMAQYRQWAAISI
jgi:4-hydroxy-2-oxoheptanedioate aldolase